MSGSPLKAYPTVTDIASTGIYRLQSSHMAVRAAILEVTGDLEAGSDPARDLTLFELVLAEVLNNIVEHAYGEDGDGEIRIFVTDMGGKVAIRTEDHGCQMPGLCLPVGNLPDTDVATDDLPEGGFGWFIFHSSTLDVSYDRKDGENHLQFTMELVS